MIRAFTGPTELQPHQFAWVVQRMVERDYNYPASIWRSGLAFGVDTIAAQVGWAVAPENELYVPFAPHNATLLLRLAVELSVIRVPRAVSALTGKVGPASAQYRRRNVWMVLQGPEPEEPEPVDELHAFTTKEAFYRSGEWMTINMAKKADINVIQEVLPPSREDG